MFIGTPCIWYGTLCINDNDLKFGDGDGLNLCRVKKSRCYHIYWKYISVWVDPRQFLRLFLSGRLKTSFEHIFRNPERPKSFLIISMPKYVQNTEKNLLCKCLFKRIPQFLIFFLLGISKKKLHLDQLFGCISILARQYAYSPHKQRE